MVYGFEGLAEEIAKVTFIFHHVICLIEERLYFSCNNFIHDC